MPSWLQNFTSMSLQNCFFIKIGQFGPLFVYFCSFLITISIQIEKSIDGVLGIQTRGRRMVGADKTTELWRPPSQLFVYIVLPIDVFAVPIGSTITFCSTNHWNWKKGKTNNRPSIAHKLTSNVYLYKINIFPKISIE